MNKIQKHVEIVRSSRGPLVSLGKYSAEAIQGVLQTRYESVGISTVNSLEDLEAVVAMRPDLVFLGVKFLTEQNVDQPILLVSDYLTLHGITHTGSPGRAIAFESDKLSAKQQVKRSGLATAAYTLINKDNLLLDAAHNLTYPLFIKPLSLGGGHGIDDNSLVHTPRELLAKASYIAERYKQDSLVEEYLPGREFSVAILRNEYTNTLVAMPIELIAEINGNGQRILGKAAKDANKEKVSAVEDIGAHKVVCDLALNVFAALGARDYGRIDIRMDAHGMPYFVEANLIPGLGNGHGYFPQACLFNANLDYRTIILAITSLGFSRSGNFELTSTEGESSPLLDPHSSLPILGTV